MKKAMMIVAIMFLSGLVYAGEYKAITGDNEVTNKDMVQVEETANIEQKTTLTLRFINNQIAVVQSRIASLESEVAEFEALKALVDAEASKVILAEPEIND